GVNVRDLRIADAIALQPALVDQPSGADPFELLEDRAGARMPVEPGMPCAAPAEVLLQDAMHDGGIATLELKGRRQNEVLAVMQNRVVVTELHIGRVDGSTLTLLGEQL